MNLLGQMREEASQRANLLALQIVDAAQGWLAQSRFVRLRKGLTSPDNKEEHDYMLALNSYVFCKIRIHRLGWDDFMKRGQLREEGGRWRNVMSLIEAHIPYEDNLSGCCARYKLEHL